MGGAIITAAGQSNFLLQIIRGTVPGYEGIVVSGLNEDIDTSFEDIWSGGGIYMWPQISSTLEAISTNAGDTAAGAGARTVLVEGLDDDFDEISEGITMNGLAASLATTQTFRRVNNIQVATAGTYGGTNVGGNFGDITVRISGGGATQGIITAATPPLMMGQGHLGRFTVPRAKRLFLTDLSVAVDDQNSADFAFIQRPNAQVVVAPMSSPIVGFLHVAITNSDQFPFQVLGPPEGLPGRTDFWIAARGGSVNARVSFLARFIMIDD